MVEFIWLIRFMLKFTAQELVNWSARVNQSAIECHSKDYQDLNVRI